MNKKIVLLNAIQNGFLENAEYHPSTPSSFIELNYAKEGAAINYCVEGNSILSGTPSIDSPASIAGVGVMNSDIYFNIYTENTLGGKREFGFLVPRGLYKLGNLCDKADYINQKTYLYTRFFNLIDMLNEEQMEVFRKDEDVVYMQLPFGGRVDIPCLSFIWPYNSEGSFNSENFGTTTINNIPIIYFGFSWDRLGLVYEDDIVYQKEDLEKTPLSDTDIVNVCISYMNTLEKTLFGILGALNNPEIIKTTLPDFKLYQGKNKIYIDIENEPIYFITKGKEKIITEDNKNIITEGSRMITSIPLTSDGNFVVSEDNFVLATSDASDLAKPYTFSISYRSSMKLS